MSALLLPFLLPFLPPLPVLQLSILRASLAFIYPFTGL